MLVSLRISEWPGAQGVRSEPLGTITQAEETGERRQKWLRIDVSDQRDDL